MHIRELDPHSECGAGSITQTECVYMRIRIRNTASKMMIARPSAVIFLKGQGHDLRTGFNWYG
jgi:hypothetical protein